MEVLFSDEFAKKLEGLAKEKAQEYINGKPFPNIYFDDFLPAEAAEAALRDFPEPKLLPWTEFNQPTQRKLAFDSVEKLAPSARNILYFLNSRPMLKFLEALTGIKGLVSDPCYIRSSRGAIWRCTLTSIFTPNSNWIAASTCSSILIRTGRRNMVAISSFGTRR
jgi:hypothetical protein